MFSGGPAVKDPTLSPPQPGLDPQPENSSHRGVDSEPVSDLGGGIGTGIWGTTCAKSNMQTNDLLKKTLVQCGIMLGKSPYFVSLF